MQVIQPGRTVGVLGSGQLGRMFAIAAKQMGYRVHVLSPDRDSPAGQVADSEFVADDDNIEVITEFARSIDVATIEFENVPVATMQAVSEFAPVRPGPHVLQKIQNRIDEKTTLAGAGFPVPSFQVIRTEDDIVQAQSGAVPAVLKTAAGGYDGKGQRVIQSHDEIADAWTELGNAECVLETFVNFACEFSVIVARDLSGNAVCYEPILNHHQNHILDVSLCPADIPATARNQALDICRGVADTLGYVGVLCVEFFQLPSGDVLINEIAPRPHNSGHLTIEAHVTSQFEQQVRAICGLPLGVTDQIRPAAMANLLGDCWENGEPNWASSLAYANTALHLYGKQDPLPGRKMGHLTCIAESSQVAAENVRLAREALQAGRSNANAQQDLNAQS